MGDGEELIAIGGIVTDADGAPIGGATVSLEPESGGARLRTLTEAVAGGALGTSGPAGSFVFTGIGRDTYTLTASMAGYRLDTTTITVPGPLGGYDLTLTAT